MKNLLHTSAIRLLVASLVLFAPATTAQAVQDDPNPADPRFRDDAAACWAHVSPGSGTICAVQYAHVFDLLNQVPLTMQRPPEDAGDVAAGFTGTPGLEPLWDFNQVRMVPTGGITYRDDGQPFMINHGVASDVAFDPTVPVFGYWSMSADMDEFAPLGVDGTPDGTDPGIGALPCLTVRMTVATGHYAGDGDVLTMGQQTKTIVTGRALADQDQPSVPTHLCAGDREAAVHIDDVVDFEIEMPPIHSAVAPETGFHAQVEWWNHAPGDPDEQDKVYLQWWNMHTGPEYAPRVVLPLERLLKVESLTVYSDDDAMYLEGWINSAFGAYAVEPGSVRLQMFNKEGHEVEITRVDTPVVRYDYNAHGFPPLRAIVGWDHEGDDLPPGTYTMRMSAWDVQGNGPAIAETQLVVLAAVEESPVLVAPFLGLVLLGLVATRRRQG